MNCDPSAPCVFCRLMALGSESLRAALSRIEAACHRPAGEALDEVAAIVEDLEAGDGPLSKRPEQLKGHK